MLKIPPLRSLALRRKAGQATPRHFSLIDLGSDTIKVAVVEVDAGQVQVLGHSLVPANSRDVAGGRAQAAALAGIINGALQEAEDASEARLGTKVVPDNCLFALPGRTVAGRIFTVNQRRAVPSSPIAQKELDSMWGRVVKLANQQLTSLPKTTADWMPQMATPAGLWLDGQLVNDPIGLRGGQLSLSAYAMACHPAIVRGLEQLAEKLEVDIYQLVPAPQTLATIIPAREALVFDIGAGGTDCLLVRHDALVAAGRVQMGGAFFTRSMANAFKCSFDDAEALKVAFASDVLSEADRALVRQSLAQPVKRWRTAVAETLAGIIPVDNERSRLPGDVYFVGGSAVLPGLKNQLVLGFKEAGFGFSREPEFSRLGETPLKDFHHEPVGFRGILFAQALSLAKTI